VRSLRIKISKLKNKLLKWTNHLPLWGILRGELVAGIILKLPSLAIAIKEGCLKGGVV
jgi:hypothetical protein